MYYSDKVPSLRSILGAAEVTLRPDRIIADDRVYPVVDDVIITLDPGQWPASLRNRVQSDAADVGAEDFAEDIQFTFGEEWKTFSDVRPEHEDVFHHYFDQIDLHSLADARVCDLGCGMGRWSWFMSSMCREIVLTDFSEAIFVARQTLRSRNNAIFVMADILKLPFPADFADFIFCLGVLHHLPTPALSEVIRLKPYARRLLVYLYYALDNRPAHYRVLLSIITPLRKRLSRVRSREWREVLTTMIALGVYRPLIAVGHVLRPFGLSSAVPLHEGYRGKPLEAIRQDVYDRFFTRIEQRVSRAEIEQLRTHYSRVDIAPTFPYWHFLCER